MDDNIKRHDAFATVVRQHLLERREDWKSSRPIHRPSDRADFERLAAWERHGATLATAIAATDRPYDEALDFAANVLRHVPRALSSEDEISLEAAARKLITAGGRIG